MNTETNKTAKNAFSRKRTIGFDPVSVDEAKPVGYFQIVSEAVENMFSKKQDKEIPYLTVVDLETGAEQRLWLSGQLRHQFTTLAEETGKLKGLKVEINWLGQKTMEIDEEKVKVNQYKIYELN